MAYIEIQGNKIVEGDKMYVVEEQQFLWFLDRISLFIGILILEKFFGKLVLQKIQP